MPCLHQLVWRIDQNARSQRVDLQKKCWITIYKFKRKQFLYYFVGGWLATIICPPKYLCVDERHQKHDTLYHVVIHLRNGLRFPSNLLVLWTFGLKHLNNEPKHSNKNGMNDALTHFHIPHVQLIKDPISQHVFITCSSTCSSRALSTKFPIKRTKC